MELESSQFELLRAELVGLRELMTEKIDRVGEAIEHNRRNLEAKTASLEVRIKEVEGRLDEKAEKDESVSRTEFQPYKFALGGVAATVGAAVIAAMLKLIHLA